MIIGILSLLVTIVVFWVAQKCYSYKRLLIFSPVLLTPAILCTLLIVFHISYEHYNAGAKYLTDMLQPATVAFSVPLYKNARLLKQYAIEIIVSLLCGSLLAMTTSMFLAEWMHLTPEMINSLIPRSITTPIAMTVSQTIGGIPTMTAVFVLFTALVGAVVGPLLIKYGKIHNKISKGLLLGMGAHGTGTAMALEYGQEEGAIASLSVVLAGIFTLLFSLFIHF
ncbi:CidB/LrgB family autolysis modulator [Fictibacillus sp. Mic-4]|uniref:CidB/LrgB family autolysis modulator n=1 Tax=Fictibacillus TaxID=1329200 RepID=UPI0004278D8E|nr:CidB/LrgB family autolysis modulator [Fictibacillus gelatini]